jgi:hypothetical protein
VHNFFQRILIIKQFVLFITDQMPHTTCT